MMIKKWLFSFIVVSSLFLYTLDSNAAGLEKLVAYDIESVWVRHVTTLTVLTPTDTLRGSRPIAKVEIVSDFPTEFREVYVKSLDRRTTHALLSALSNAPDVWAEVVFDQLFLCDAPLRRIRFDGMEQAIVDVCGGRPSGVPHIQTSMRRLDDLLSDILFDTINNGRIVTDR